MITLLVDGKAYKIPYEVNDAIISLMQETERLKSEGDKLRAEVRKAAWTLNKVRAELIGWLERIGTHGVDAHVFTYDCAALW